MERLKSLVGAQDAAAAGTRYEYINGAANIHIQGEEEGSVAGPEMLKLRPALARLQYKSVFIYQRGRKDTYSERRRSGGQCWWP